MSDWHGYSERLSQKLGYTNTFYHQEPFLDITRPPPDAREKYDFIVSGDVMEHVPAPIKDAFSNLFRLLKKDGVLVLTVPFEPTGETVEHFPDLHQFEVVTDGNKQRLKNITKEGQVQWFDDLIFHAGEGATLEMRFFALPSITGLLSSVGFTDIQLHNRSHYWFGIRHNGPWSFPISARKPG